MAKPRTSWVHIQGAYVVPLSVICRYTKARGQQLRVRTDSLNNLRLHMEQRWYATSDRLRRNDMTDIAGKTASNGPTACGTSSSRSQEHRSHQLHPGGRTRLRGTPHRRLRPRRRPRHPRSRPRLRP